MFYVQMQLLLEHLLSMMDIWIICSLFGVSPLLHSKAYQHHILLIIYSYHYIHTLKNWRRESYTDRRGDAEQQKEKKKALELLKQF